MNNNSSSASEKTSLSTEDSSKLLSSASTSQGDASAATKSAFSIDSLLATSKVPRGRRPNAKYPRVQVRVLDLKGTVTFTAFDSISFNQKKCRKCIYCYSTFTITSFLKNNFRHAKIWHHFCYHFFQ